MKKLFVEQVIHVMIAGIITLSIASCGNTGHDMTYVPSEEFMPAYQALTEAYESPATTYDIDSTGLINKVQTIAGTEEGEYYDIEETVRILNGLELAQSQSEDFYSYLEYMARQDYSMVPKEVVAAKLKLLPILQEMFTLEKESENFTKLTMVFNSLGTGLHTFAYESDISQIPADLYLLLDNTPLGGFKKILDTVLKMTGSESQVARRNNLQALNTAKVAAFDNYAKAQRLRSDNLRRIEQLKEKYLEYINEFTPIYMKYMKEWDALCLEKDNAYLAVYSGRSTDGYNATSKILEKYPANRETILLKAISCLNLACENSNQTSDSYALTAEGTYIPVGGKYRFMIEARTALDNYLKLYPEKAAPALVLLGQLAIMEGQDQKAMSYFDQASIEYPKQAEELRDMLNSYSIRNYLNATPEGLYLLRLYRSTMEGYGWFSPNFQKARYLDAKGDKEGASAEIYNHFFRRNNQKFYDCLLTDMEFCENNLYRSFKSQFMESSTLDLSVSEDTHIFGKNGVSFKLSNNSDLNLENVRLFICLHLKDMYINEYDVLPCESINSIPHGSTYQWKSSEYTIEDIVRVRAILMTDDRVCWVDDINFKQSNAKKNFYQLNGKTPKSLEMFEDFGIAEDEMVKLMQNSASGYSVTLDQGGVKGLIQGVTGQDKGTYLTFEFPRILCLIDPVFSMGELNGKHSASTPTLSGSLLKVKFKFNPEDEYKPLYLYSEFINLKIDYIRTMNDKIDITRVTQI